MKYGVSRSLSLCRSSQAPPSANAGLIYGTAGLSSGQYLREVPGEGAAGHYLVAAGRSGGYREVLLDVGEEADGGHAPEVFFGLYDPEEFQWLEAGGVQVEDEEVRRGLAEGVEEFIGAAGEAGLD